MNIELFKVLCWPVWLLEFSEGFVRWRGNRCSESRVSMAAMMCLSDTLHDYLFSHIINQIGRAHV